MLVPPVPGIVGVDGSEERPPSGLNIVDELAVPSAGLLLHTEHFISVESVDVAVEPLVDCVVTRAKPDLPLALTQKLAG